MLILASQSPRREALLRAAGLRFCKKTPEEEEATPAQARNYPALVQARALQKAESVAARRSDLVLGADTIVVCEGQILGKPASVNEARRMLQRLSGRRHWVYTGVALVAGDLRRQDYERTSVTFRELTEKEIGRYIATGEPMDKAGAYAIQGNGAAFIAQIRGCYTNVIGLPMPKLLEMLRAGACLGSAGGGFRPLEQKEK